MAGVYCSRAKWDRSVRYMTMTRDALVFAAAYSVSDFVRLSHAADADRGPLRRERTIRNYGLRSLAWLRLDWLES